MVFKRKIEAFLEKGLKEKRILVEYPKQVRQEIVESGAIVETILRSAELAESAKKHLDTNNKQWVFFDNMCDIAIDNKFYQFFK